MLLNTFISNNFVGAAAGGGGPVVVDSQEASNTGHRTPNSGGVYSDMVVSWTFTNTSGTLLLVGVAVTEESAVIGPVLCAVPTANSTPMTLLGSQYDVHGDSRDMVAIYYMLSPPTGSVSISVTGTGGGGAGTGRAATLAGAISFTGNSASSPFGTPVTASATSGTHALAPSITTSSGNYLFGVGNYGAGTTASADSGQTATYKLIGSSDTAGDDICAVTKASAGSGIQLGFTWSGSDNWGIMAVAVQA